MSSCAQAGVAADLRPRHQHPGRGGRDPRPDPPPASRSLGASPACAFPSRRQAGARFGIGLFLTSSGCSPSSSTSRPRSAGPQWSIAAAGRTGRAARRLYRAAGLALAVSCPFLRRGYRCGAPHRGRSRSELRQLSLPLSDAEAKTMRIADAHAPAGRGAERRQRQRTGAVEAHRRRAGSPGEADHGLHCERAESATSTSALPAWARRCVVMSPIWRSSSPMRGASWKTRPAVLPAR